MKLRDTNVPEMLAEKADHCFSVLERCERTKEQEEKEEEEKRREKKTLWAWGLPDNGVRMMERIHRDSINLKKLPAAVECKDD